MADERDLHLRMPWHRNLRWCLHARRRTLQWQQCRSLRQQWSVDIDDVLVRLPEWRLHRYLHTQRKTVQQQQQPDLQRQRPMGHVAGLSVCLLGRRKLHRPMRANDIAVSRHDAANLRRGGHMELADRLHLRLCQRCLHRRVSTGRETVSRKRQPDL